LSFVQAEEIPLQELGQPWQGGDIPIRWKASLQNLPSSAAVYRVVSGTFSPGVVSNLLKLAGLTEKDRKKPSWDGARKQDLSFRDNDEVHILDISPEEGFVVLRDTEAIAEPRERVTGVPDDEEALSKALTILSQLGIRVDELAKWPGSDRIRRTGGRREQGSFDSTQGKLVKTVIARQLFLIRAFEGIPSLGLGGGGGIWLSFGNHGQLAELRSVWRKVEMKGRYSVVSKAEFVERLRKGECVCDTELHARLEALTVHKITPYYLERRGGEPQEEIHPVTELEAEAQLTSTNIAVRLYCPLLVYH
jgi:hypothetical protein